MRVFNLDTAAVVTLQCVAPIGNGEAVFECLDHGVVVHPFVVTGLFAVLALVRGRQVPVPVVFNVDMAFAAFGIGGRRPGDREVLLVFEDVHVGEPRVGTLAVVAFAQGVVQQASPFDLVAVEPELAQTTAVRDVDLFELVVLKSFVHAN